MQIELTLKGSSVNELKEQVRKLNDELNGVEHTDVDVSTIKVEGPAPVEPIVQPDVVADNSPDLLVPENSITSAIMTPSTATLPTKAPEAVRSEVKLGELDSAGVRFDSRIHISQSKTNKDGSWKKKRGLDLSFYNQVLAEQKVGTPVTANPQPPQTYTNVEIPQGDKPAHSFDTFRVSAPSVMALLHASGKLSAEYIQSLCAHFQVNHLWEIFPHEEKLRELFDGLTQHGFITRLD